MGHIEIERKYLVRDESFKHQAIKVHRIEQGYLALQPAVRIRLQDEEAFLTIKGQSDASGLGRAEYEYSIPLEDGRELLRLAGARVLCKDRYLVPYEGEVWEVDVFGGRYAGLIIAELELSSPEAEYSLPPWVGEEVTGQTQYYNASMAMNQDPTQQ